MLLIANFWEHLEWTAPWGQGWHGEREGEQKVGCGRSRYNYFLILFTFPPIIRLSSSTFPISALSSRGERTDRRRDEANRSWVDRKDEVTTAAIRDYSLNLRKMQEEVTSTSNCRLAYWEIQEKRRELKACRTVNMPALVCVSANENMNTHMHIRTYQYLNRTHLVWACRHSQGDQNGNRLGKLNSTRMPKFNMRRYMLHNWAK